MSRRGQIPLSVNDGVRIDRLNKPTDNALLNASQSAHGLMPKNSGLLTDRFTGQGQTGVLAYRRVTVDDADYSVQKDDLYIGMINLSADRNITLPKVGDVPLQVFVFKDESGNGSPGRRMIIASTSGERIDGFGTWEINDAYGHATLTNNGTDAWFVIADRGSNGA